MDRRVLDEAKASSKASRLAGERDPVVGHCSNVPIQFLFMLKGDSKEGEVEILVVGEGRLIDPPSLHKRRTLSSSRTNDSLVDLNSGGEVEGTRGSPGWQ